jgi:hypothetical protein
LSQNYPNPFNPVTRISYETPVDGAVKIRLFDALGRMVEVLVDEFKPAGVHSVTLNASGLSSGLYLYSMDANGINQVRKMVVLR